MVSTHRAAGSNPAGETLYYQLLVVQLKSMVKMYTKPSCVQCDASHRKLEAEGIKYEVIDLSENPEAIEEVKELGYLQAPVIVVDKDNHWSGFRPDKIEALA